MINTSSSYQGKKASLMNFSKCINPLLRLDAGQITSMFNTARCGSDWYLQLAYAEMMKVYPILNVCFQRRTEGVLNRKWVIKSIDESPSSKEQAKVIEDELFKSESRNIDGFSSCLNDLAMYAFNGRAVVKPYFDDDGNLMFKTIPNIMTAWWNNTLYFNKDGNFLDLLAYSIDDLLNKDNLVEIPISECMLATTETPINYAALPLYLRTLIGEEQWARLVETQGIPQVVINAPTGVRDTQLEVFKNRAVAIMEGGSGVLPNGARTNVLDSARGQDPFTSYLKHQMELIAILATGGTATVLPTSTGMNSDLAERQEKVFNNLVDKDCKIIENTINEVTVPKILSYKSNVNNLENIKVKFEFVKDSDITTNEYLDEIKKMKDLGFKLDPKKVKDLVGLDILDEENPIIEEWSPSSLSSDGQDK